MGKKTTISLTVITMIVGFMIAIQFRTVKEPDIRDTRDMWELREALSNETDLQSKLINEIRTNEETIEKYETQMKDRKEDALNQTLEKLKEQAGLTEVSGSGMVMSIDHAPETKALGMSLTENVSPELLQRLVNELNMYEAKHISIDEQRIINTTVIRDINKETKINGHTIKIPFEIKVITKNYAAAEKMYNHMQISPSLEEFFIDNLRVNIKKPERNITIPAYEGSIRVRGMKPVKEKGEK